MNIYFLENVQTFGGARKSTVELAKRLSNEHNVSIIDINGNCKPFVEQCHQQNLNLVVVDKDSKIKILSSGSFFKQIWNRLLFIFYALKMNIKINNFLKDKEESYVIVNNSKVLSYIFIKPKNIKIALFARGWFVNQQITFLDRFLYKRLVDKYIGVSQATRQAIYCSGLAKLDKIVVVHNAINLNEIDIMPSQSSDIRILLSGGFLPTKGQLTAIEIAKRLKTIYPDSQMIITGIIYKGNVSSKYYEYIKSIIEEYGLQDNVKIAVDVKNIFDYFKWCSIFIHPSDTEGLPRVVMEAMASKRPVIANAVGGVIDYVLDGYTGILTRHNNVNDYVDAIRKLSENREYYDFIVCNAYNLIKTSYTESIQISQFQKVLSD